MMTYVADAVPRILIDTSVADPISTGISGGPLLVADGTVDGNDMSGNYTATEAGGTQHTGTWSATKQ